MNFSVAGKSHLFLILTDIYFNRIGDEVTTEDYELSDRVPVLDIRDGVVETVTLQTLTSDKVFPYVCNLRGFFVDSGKVTVEKLLFGRLFTLSAWEETIGNFVVDSKKYKVVLKDDSMITIDGIRCGIYGDNRYNDANELLVYSNDKRVPFMKFVDGLYFWSCLELYYRVGKDSVVLNYTVYTMGSTYEISQLPSVGILLSLVYNIKTQKCLGYYIYVGSNVAYKVQTTLPVLNKLGKNVLRGY